MSYEGMHKIEKFTLTPLEQKEKGAQMTHQAITTL